MREETWSKITEMAQRLGVSRSDLIEILVRNVNMKVVVGGSIQNSG